MEGRMKNGYKINFKFSCLNNLGVIEPPVRCD